MMAYKSTLHDSTSIYFLNLSSPLLHPFFHFQPISYHFQVPNVLLLSRLQAFTHTLPFTWMQRAKARSKVEDGDNDNTPI